jgi:hypothetical protein
MNEMRRGLDIEKVEAALKRAAHKALHGTREERSGRFMLKDKLWLPARKKERSSSGRDAISAKDDSARGATRSTQDRSPRKA